MMLSIHSSVVLADTPDRPYADTLIDYLPVIEMGIVHECAISEGLPVERTSPCSAEGASAVM